MAYLINPDRTNPWNDLPELPIDKILYEDIDIYRQLEILKLLWQD
jgi:hypothetical protein